MRASTFISPHTHHPALLPCLPRSYSVGRAPYCWFGALDASGQLVKDFPVPLPQPIMMHDFAVTEDYVIFFDCSLVFKPEVGGGWGGCSCAVGTRVLGRGGDFPTHPCFNVRHDAPTAAGWLCAPAHANVHFCQPKKINEWLCPHCRNCAGACRHLSARRPCPERAF